MNQIDIIYSVITRLEINRLQTEIEKIDPNAFIVMNSVKEYYRWCTEHGCIAAAIVVKNSVQRSYIEKYFSGNFAVFNSKKEAIDWLMEYNNT